MKRKVLLTGASGEVGFEAFKELRRKKENFETRILSLGTQGERKLFQPYGEQVEIVWGDIRNPEDVKEAVSGVDAVLHVAGIIPPVADHHPELARQVNVGGTRNIIKAIKQQKNPPNLVFTSSISVYGDRLENPDIRVTDPLNPSDGDEYAWTKIEAEEMIRESGIRWTIFRLCGILVNKLRIQPLMFHMPLETALEWCHASDAGYALVQAIEQDSVFGRIFNLGGGQQCQIKARNFLRKMFPLWGLRPDLLPEYAFATRNFHSGYYADGDELNDLLNFRRKTLQDYLDTVSSTISPIQRSLVRMLPRFAIRDWLLRMSEPLEAIKNNNEELIARFYGSRDAFQELVTRGASK